MQRLFDESEATVATLRNDRDVMDAIVQREREFATQLVHRGQCPPAPMWEAVDTLPMYPTISIPSAAYQEMMGAGGLSEIDDPQTRTAISNFRSMFEWVQGQNEYFREHVWRLPLADTRVRYDFVEAAEEPQVSHYDRAELCSDLTFRNGIADAVRNHWFISKLRQNIAARSIKICAMIGSSLGKTCVPSIDGPLKGKDLEIAKRAVADFKKAQAAH
jgi:hypothetical protein